MDARKFTQVNSTKWTFPFIVLYLKVMDYLVGFFVGYFIKEVVTLIKTLAQPNFEIIEYDYDEDWD